jgi:hypothetical protein
MKIYFVAFVLSIFVMPGQARISAQSAGYGQSRFAAEEVPGEPRIHHPITIPDGAVSALQRDRSIQSCLKYNPLGPGQSLRSWFVASSIHLDGSTEGDLVVVPSLKGQQSPCFESPAGIGKFWILRKNGGRYELVLSTWGGSLEILPTKTNGLRDVKTDTLGQAGKNLTIVTFHFNGTHYVVVKDTTHERR